MLLNIGMLTTDCSGRTNDKLVPIRIGIHPATGAESICWNAMIDGQENALRSVTISGILKGS